MYFCHLRNQLQYRRNPPKCYNINRLFTITTLHKNDECTIYCMILYEILSESLLQKLSSPTEMEETLKELRKAGRGGGTASSSSSSISLPSKSVFGTLARFLIHEDLHIREVVTHYFFHLSDSRRRQV
jgi:hypothetical protein